MTEHDIMQLKQSPKTTRGYLSTTRFGLDVVRGLTTFVKHEISRPDLKSNDASSRFSGVGAQWFPHPHLEVSADLGIASRAKDFTYSNQGNLILFYYF